MDVQFLIVIVVVAAAVIYAGRAYWRQFTHAEDAHEDCAGCPAASGEDQAGGEGDLVSISGRQR
jgi:hypothetical protein